MFKGANMPKKVRPKEGDKILVRASVGIYEARGDYQLVVDFMEPEGEGQLKQQFEMLKLKLASEGLFATASKQAMPKHIKTIGIITSPTGAALHDILSVLKRRNPSISVIIYPSQVQGETAPLLICKAIDIAISRNEVDVLLVGRGGGSLEDLWCFNDETVARKLFACPIPTVSAVGHEVDVTICDFVADLRAPTPSAAAELLSLDQMELLSSMRGLTQRLSLGMQKQLQHHKHQNQIIFKSLQQNHTYNRIKQQVQRLDNLTMALDNATQRRIEQTQRRLEQNKQPLERVSPERQIQRQLQSNQYLNSQLHKSMANILSNLKFRLAKSSELLDSVSPLSTLSRGYSITYCSDKIIKSEKEVAAGDEIVTRLHDGQIKSRVV